MLKRKQEDHREVNVEKKLKTEHNRNGKDEKIDEKMEDKDEQCDTTTHSIRYTYEGSVWRCKKGWQVRFHQGGKVISTKYFSDRKHSKDETKSKLAAEEWRKIESDRLGKTKKTIIPIVPMHVQQFIAGFLDADGMISMIKNKRASGKFDYYIFVDYRQSCNSGIPAELLYVQQYYRGIIFKDKPSLSTNKTPYRLRIQAIDDLVILVPHLIAHCVVKKTQAEIAFRFLQNRTQLNEAAKEKVFKQLKDAKNLQNYQSIQPDKSRVMIPYLAGLYCGDGCFTIYKNKQGTTVVQVRLSQKSNIRLLYVIKELYNPRSSIDEKDGVLETKAYPEVEKFLMQLLPHMVGPKKPQAQILLDFVQLPKKDRTRDFEQIPKWIAEVKRLKKL